MDQSVKYEEPGGSQEWAFYHPDFEGFFSPTFVFMAWYKTWPMKSQPAHHSLMFFASSLVPGQSKPSFI
jgi:hypothetical protein